MVNCWVLNTTRGSMAKKVLAEELNPGVLRGRKWKSDNSGLGIRGPEFLPMTYHYLEGAHSSLLVSDGRWFLSEARSQWILCVLWVYTFTLTPPVLSGRENTLPLNVSHVRSIMTHQANLRYLFRYFFFPFLLRYLFRYFFFSFPFLVPIRVLGPLTWRSPFGLAWKCTLAWKPSHGTDWMRSSVGNLKRTSDLDHLLDTWDYVFGNMICDRDFHPFPRPEGEWQLFMTSDSSGLTSGWQAGSLLWWKYNQPPQAVTV